MINCYFCQSDFGNFVNYPIKVQVASDDEVGVEYIPVCSHCNAEHAAFHVKPYELPTEEKIRKEILNLMIPHYWQCTVKARKERIDKTIKAITNLLKGEKECEHERTMSQGPYRAVVCKDCGQEL